MRRSARWDAEFSEFVAARSTQLYRNAYLLTMSPHSADDLVQTALANAYAAWPRVRSADDPVAYVHGIVLKSFLCERRRRSSSELPVAEAPERPGRGARRQAVDLDAGRPAGRGGRRAARRGAESATWTDWVPPTE